MVRGNESATIFSFEHFVSFAKDRTSLKYYILMITQLLDWFSVLSKMKRWLNIRYWRKTNNYFLRNTNYIYQVKKN